MKKITGICIGGGALLALIVALIIIVPNNKDQSKNLIPAPEQTAAPTPQVESPVQVTSPTTSEPQAPNTVLPETKPKPVEPQPAANPSQSPSDQGLSLTGITIAPEITDCGYDRKHYDSYNARALRNSWQGSDGLIIGFYSGQSLRNDGQVVHVEHVVSLKEACQSGHKDPSFGNWSTNLRPAKAGLNISKGEKDPQEWQKPTSVSNQRWCDYLQLHTSVKATRKMTMDRAEHDYIISWQSRCDWTLVGNPPVSSTPSLPPRASATEPSNQSLSCTHWHAGHPKHTHYLGDGLHSHQSSSSTKCGWLF